MPKKGYSKPEAERRRFTAKTLLTQSEWDHFNACVEGSVFPTDAAYLRALIAGEHIPAKRSAHQLDVLRELSRIGNNLNQLARVANANGRISERALQFALEEFHQTLRQLTLKR